MTYTLMFDDILNDRRQSYQSKNVKKLSLRLNRVNLNEIRVEHPISSEGQEIIAEELVALQSLNAAVTRMVTDLEPLEWEATFPQLYVLLLLSATSLQFRIQSKISYLQSQLYNFEPIIMDAVGYDIDKLFGDR